MDTVGFDIDCVLGHKLQDVLDGGRVRQAAQPHAVSRAGHGDERRSGEQRDGKHRRRRRSRNGGDEWIGHVAVQDLKANGVEHVGHGKMPIPLKKFKRFLDCTQRLCDRNDRSVTTSLTKAKCVCM